MTKTQLVADIRVTFPKIVCMERDDCMSGQRKWMISGEQSVVMPDGLPAFSDWQHYSEMDTHDDGVHCGFANWLEYRGWYLEREDAFWFVPTPMPSAEELEEYRRQCEAIAASYAAENIDRLLDEVPF